MSVNGMTITSMIVHIKDTQENTVVPECLWKQLSRSQPSQPVQHHTVSLLGFLEFLDNHGQQRGVVAAGDTELGALKLLRARGERRVTVTLH